MLTKKDNSAEFGLGPKIPPIENAKDTITEVLGKINAVLGDEGLKLNKFVRITGGDQLNLKITQAVGDTSPSGVRIDLLEPQPRLNILGWLKSRLTGVTVSSAEVVVHIDKFPDLHIEVAS
jgi:hypothetical protein